MARGKNSRRRLSASSSVHPNIIVKPQVDTAIRTCKTCASNGLSRCSGQCLLNPAIFGHKSAQEVEEAIEYHWKILPTSISQFLLADPNLLCLQRFVSFYSMPEHADNTTRNVAASICGCSWYLALHYMFLGKFQQAKGLILNAAFLQEVYNNKPISEIAALCTSELGQKSTLTNVEFKQALPFFHDGLFACSSRENMIAFLRTKLTPTFVAQTSQAKRQAQTYVQDISRSWGKGGTDKDSNPGSEEIQVVLIDSDTDEQKTLNIGSNSTLKSLFNKYADERGISLRSLRFSYNNKTLFLSSIGQKTPSSLGIKNLDIIVVAKNEQETSISSIANTKINRCGSNSPGSGGMTRRTSLDLGKPRANRRATWTGCSIDTSSEAYQKLMHSRQLTILFDEAEPIFTKIRQQLNDRSIQRSKPKRRSTTSRQAPVVVQHINNFGSEGLGGKAGKVLFNVNVGQVENLYKTRKTVASYNRSALYIDLHGHTKEQAETKLDECLPEWIDIAMRGEYPFVIPVTIVCGGGAQVLSETVERWIKENDGIANAPKRIIPRRITMV